MPAPANQSKILRGPQVSAVTVTRSGDKPHTTCKNPPMIQFIHGASQSHTGVEAEKTRGLNFSLCWSHATREPHEGAGTSGCLAEPAAGLAPCCSPWMHPETKLPTDLGTPQRHTRGLLTPRFCGTRPACVPSEHALPKFPQSCFLPNIKGRNKIYVALPNWIPPRKEFQPTCHTMAFFPLSICKVSPISRKYKKTMQTNNPLCFQSKPLHVNTP